MTAAMAGDGRFRYLYAHPGTAARSCSAEPASSYPIGRGCGLGPSCSRWACSARMRPERSRAGSATSCSRREPVAFVDPSVPNERTLRSGHGSLTPDEMYVPLLAERGRRA